MTEPRPETHPESSEALLRERWGAVKDALKGEELRLALHTERLLAEFHPPAFALSRAHFVQTVVATCQRVPATADQRARLAQVTRRLVLGGRPDFG